MTITAESHPNPHRPAPVKLTTGNWWALISIAVSVIVSMAAVQVFLFDSMSTRIDRANDRYASLDTNVRMLELKISQLAAREFTSKDVRELSMTVTRLEEQVSALRGDMSSIYDDLRQLKTRKEP